MSALYQSLSHSRWNCKYHVVFVPKRRRKKLFGEIRRQLGPIFHELARQKEQQSGKKLSTSPHKRGVEIMRLWPWGFHTWPSLSPRIWWTTETDGPAHSIRPHTPSSVPPEVSCPQKRRSATASAARASTTVRLGASRSHARGESAT